MPIPSPYVVSVVVGFQMPQECPQAVTVRREVWSQHTPRPAKGCARLRMWTPPIHWLHDVLMARYSHHRSTFTGLY